MKSIKKPNNRPSNPSFSSGPCAKRPGWSADALASALVGRSHRSKPGKERIQEVIDKTRIVLGIPNEYKVGIVAGSDTGAVEMAMWSLLGPRSVDILQWESFGKGWVTDIRDQLNLADIREIKADYGLIPDLNTVDFNNDVVFTWNGTTSGVRVPDGDWIPRDRQGLTICDATSAAFAMHLPWDKLDFTTYSWQKVMGGEAQHGIIILSPRAVDRLESYSPPWPLPKIFRLTKNGKIDEAIFKGATINTPSMICVEDALDGLNWAISIGGLSALIKRSEDNLTAVKRWVENSEDIEFLAKDPRTISSTSICISIVAPWFKNLDEKEQSNSAKTICSLLDSEGVGYDIESYRDAPPGLRIWGGSTVETSDVKSLTQWIDWAMGEVAVKYL